MTTLTVIVVDGHAITIGGLTVEEYFNAEVDVFGFRRVTDEHGREYAIKPTNVGAVYDHTSLLAVA